jgi:hypothetical protein
MSRSVQNYASDTPFGREQSRDLPAVRVIPYDYVAQFDLRGEPGNLIQDVINVSVEGVFVAVSIGYGIQEEHATPFNVLTSNGDSSPSYLGDITLGDIPPDVLIEGFRIAPEFEAIAIKNDRLNDTLPISLASTIFQRLRSPANITFLLSIVDSATGRELQNEPVHSVATLGDANGRRPFRALSQPMVFMPRSTIRLQIEERTKDVTGTLFITLQGYKVLGVAGTDEEEVRRLIHLDPLRRIPVYEYETGNYRALGEAILRDVPTTGVVPFDYVSTLDLRGKPGRIVEDEIPVNIDGGYVALAIGYSLDPGDVGIEVDRSDDLVPLNEIKLTEFRPAQALLDGIRIDPVRLRLAFTSGGLSVLPRDTVQRMFQRLNPAEDVRFLYSIIDSGTGRELQNRPVDNIAGMGTASGERPFRILHKPMMFLPRSTIRVQVKEISGRGRLFIVFQGYKMLT